MEGQQIDSQEDREVLSLIQGTFIQLRKRYPDKTDAEIHMLVFEKLTS